jgi:hypothetical protein
MPYTTEEGGRLNNFAKEPKMYQAEPMSASQKQIYLWVTLAAAVLLGGLITLATLAS